MVHPTSPGVHDWELILSFTSKTLHILLEREETSSLLEVYIYTELAKPSYIRNNDVIVPLACQSTA